MPAKNKSVPFSNELRHVAVDTNHWNTFGHARLATAPGDKGCLTIFSRKPEGHRLLAAHVADAETWTATEGHGRVVHEWRLKPSKPDNHWLDCLVGCAAGASMCRVRLPGMHTPPPRRRKGHTQEDLRRR